jgi:hypothetical protein
MALRHLADIVILDNLGSHKGKAVRKAIRNVGSTAIVAILPHCPPKRRRYRSCHAKAHVAVHNGTRRIR